MGETSGMGPAFKVTRIAIKQRLAHRKYKKSDAKVIASKIKQIQDKLDKPDKPDMPLRRPRFLTYKPYCPNREAHQHQYRGVDFMIHDGGKTTHTVMSVNDPIYKELF